MIDGMFIGIWLSGFFCGVGLTGKLMTRYWKADWIKPHKTHKQRYTDIKNHSYVPRKVINKDHLF